MIFDAGLTIFPFIGEGGRSGGPSPSFFKAITLNWGEYHRPPEGESLFGFYFRRGHALIKCDL